MIKVQGFSLYGPLAASTRYRLEQYIPGLAALGIDLRVHYLLGDPYLSRRFQGASIAWGYLLRTGWQRLVDLRTQQQADIRLIYGELLPFMPGWVEQLLLQKPYLYDLDDALYLKYRLGRFKLLRGLLGTKFDVLMQGAAAVTGGNQNLCAYAQRFNTQVHWLPTVVDTTRYLPQPLKSSTFTLGWIGSPSTAVYLTQLIEPLQILAKEAPIRLVVIGGKAPVIPGVLVEELAWSEASEVALLNSFDVGLMPLTDDPWARGKCAFKLVQYMACALPVVASRVGANIDLVTPDCGFLVSDTGQWVEALRMLRTQPQLRASMGEAARTRIQEHYSLQTALPVLASVIEQHAPRGTR